MPGNFDLFGLSSSTFFGLATHIMDGKVSISTVSAETGIPDTVIRDYLRCLFSPTAPSQNGYSPSSFSQAVLDNLSIVIPEPVPCPADISVSLDLLLQGILDIPSVSDLLGLSTGRVRALLKRHTGVSYGSFLSLARDRAAAVKPILCKEKDVTVSSLPMLAEAYGLPVRVVLECLPSQPEGIQKQGNLFFFAPFTPYHKVGVSVNPSLPKKSRSIEESKSRALASLKRVSETAGEKSLSARVYSKNRVVGDYSPTYIQNLFGSWNQAVAEAGLVPMGRVSEKQTTSCVGS